MNRTNIDYLDFTWNPIVMRCTPCSPGCSRCWHLRMCNRMESNYMVAPFQQDIYAGARPPAIITERLEEPLRIKSPARIGVQFMGDLFHRDVPHSMINEVFATIALAPQHKFFVRTKRIREARVYLNTATDNREEEIGAAMRELSNGADSGLIELPLPNVWLGVSICNQQEADEKIPVLRCISAAHRWLSIEPLLESVFVASFNGIDIDYVVVGPETGPHARPCDPAWIVSIVQQCAQAGVEYHVKGKRGKP